MICERGRGELIVFEKSTPQSLVHTFDNSLAVVNSEADQNSTTEEYDKEYADLMRMEKEQDKALEMEEPIRNGEPFLPEDL